MKVIIVLSTIALFTLSCATTGQKRIAKPEKDYNTLVLADNEVSQLNNLESYLNRTAGVRVSGSGQSASVQVRGVNSINSGTQPLFVVNGTDVGTSYATAADLVRSMKIESVRVLKGADATLYGVRGGGGVILIKAK